MRNALTGRLAALEAELVVAAESQPFLFGDGRYTFRVANDLESREKAYRLVYRLYREKEYVKPNASRMWFGAFDALPETITLLAERAGDSAAVGALTVVFDSAAGLPADELYKTELDALRASGRRLSEIISLGVDADAAGGSEVLVRLFNLVYIASRRIRGATDFMITVNPRHAGFYQKTLLFAPAGPERSYDKVGGAPAVLLRLDLDVPEERVRLEHGPAETRPARSRTLYPMFLPPREEPGVAAGMRMALKPLSSDELRRFFPEMATALSTTT